LAAAEVRPQLVKDKGLQQRSPLRALEALAGHPAERADHSRVEEVELGMADFLSSLRPTLPTPCPDLIEDLLARYPLTARELVVAGTNGGSHFGEADLVQSVSVLEKPKSLTYDFARGEVPSSLHLVVDELLKLLGERNVHANGDTLDGNLCQRLLSLACDYKGARLRW
jgi:hypothetical protein